jgi:hypothetical protein
MTTITLDQITAAAATIADEPKAQGEAMAAIILELSKPVATIDEPTIAPEPAPTMPAWMARPASRTQIERIMRAEEAILASGRKRGIALIERHHGEFTNAGTASTYYKSLAAFTRKHGIQF